MSDVPPGFARSDHSSPLIDLIGPIYDTGAAAGYRLGLRVETRHTNRIGQCHGAVTAALADVHLLRLIALTSEPRLTCVTTHLAIDYLAAAPLGAWLEASGRVDRMGRTMCHSSGIITADGKPVIRATGVFQILKS